jgi:HAD superfamily hydrolase (TIGR01490 family)
VSDKLRLVLFDLDHTLLAGDSDVLWCEFLMDKGLLDRAQFAARNADMEARYKAGTVSAQAFAGFYVGTLAGHSPASLDALRREFLRSMIVPRIPAKAAALVESHLGRGDLCVMTTATNRYITELTAAHLRIPHLVATEAQVEHGRFTGRPEGVLNMREGKVTRLHAWLRERGERLDAFASTAYSDSINDQPLLEAVDEPVAVDPDPRLMALAAGRGWRQLSLRN